MIYKTVKNRGGVLSNHIIKVHPPTFSSFCAVFPKNYIVLNLTFQQYWLEMTQPESLKQNSLFTEKAKK